MRSLFTFRFAVFTLSKPKILSLFSMAPKRPSMQAPPPAKPSSEEESSEEEEVSDGVGGKASRPPPPPLPPPSNKPSKKKTTLTPQSSSSTHGADESKKESDDSDTENHLNIAAIPNPSTKPLPLKPTEETSKSKKKVNLTSVKRNAENDGQKKVSKRAKTDMTSVKRNAEIDRQKKDSKRTKTDKRGEKVSSSQPPPPFSSKASSLPPPPSSSNKKPSIKKTTVSPQPSSSTDGFDESKEESDDSDMENPLASKPTEEASKSKKKVNVTPSNRTAENVEKKDSTPPPPPSSSNSKPSEKKTTVSPPSSSSTDEADESEDESDDSDTENPLKIPSIPDASANPIASKPREETSKSNQNVIPVNGTSENDMEKKDSKRVFFVRIWSEDDEIAILNGLLEYSSYKGVDPFQDLNVFYEFAKQSVRADVSKSQFIDKVRKLKQKFKDNIKKGKKNGEDPVFKKPHDEKVFVLSKKIWGGEVVKSVEAKNANRKTTKSTKSEVSRKNAEKSNNLSDDKEEKGLEMENYSDDAVCLRCWVKYSKKLGVSDVDEESPDLDERSMKEGLELLPNSKKRELAERWKKLVCREMEICLNRLELLREQVNMVRMVLGSKYHSEI